ASCIGFGQFTTEHGADIIVGGKRYDTSINAFRGNVSLLHLTPDGSFLLLKSITVGSNISALTVEHVNRDNNLDIVGADDERGEVWSLLGNGANAFKIAGSKRNRDGYRPSSIATADFDRDGN